MSALVPAWDNLPQHLSWRDRVALLTYRSLESLEQVATPLTHLFEPGRYIRELTVPANVLLTGREHVHGHLLELKEGSALLFAPDGTHRFDAPASMNTKPGFAAVAYTLTRIVARTVHENYDECRDIEALEARWFAPPGPVIERGRVIYEQLTQGGTLPCPQPSVPAQPF